MKTRSEGHFALGLKVVGSLALVLLLCAVNVRAAEESTTKTETKTTETKKSTKTTKHAKHHGRRHRRGKRTVSIQRQVNDLRGQVSNLRRRQDQLAREVRRIEQDIIVVPPPSPTAAPRTVGQHVAVIEQDLSETRRELAENLGVHIHGLLDATYEANFNNPNSSTVGPFVVTGPQVDVTTPPGPAAVIAKGGSPQSLFPGGRINQFRAFDTEANGFQLTQFNLHIDRTVEQGVGFVLDLNFGKTAEILRQSTRYSNNNPGTTNFDVIDPTQAYLTYTLPVGHGINISAGKFVTLLGAETVNTYNNLNYNESKSFIFSLGIPFTHTGVRANYAFTDRIGATVGINNGWDDVSDNNDGKTFEGQIALQPWDFLGLTVNGTYGPEQVNRGNSQLGAVDTVGWWKTPLRGLTLVGEYLYAQEDGPITTASIVPTSDPGSNALQFASLGIFNPSTPPANAKCNGVAVGTPQPIGATGSFEDTLCDPTDWQGAAVYIIFDLTDRISLVGRGEYFRDSAGVRTGIRQSLWEGTGTINYKLTHGLLARLEFRHDESNARPFETHEAIQPGIGGGGFAFGIPEVPISGTGTTSSGQDTLEGALIYSF